MYKVYILELIGFNNFQSKLVNEVESIEQANELISELQSQGISAYYSIS